MQGRAQRDPRRIGPMRPLRAFPENLARVSQPDGFRPALSPRRPVSGRAGRTSPVDRDDGGGG